MNDEYAGFFAAQFLASTSLATGTITGNVFADLNANGVQDTGEGGFGGAAVYVDLNGDDTLDLAWSCMGCNDHKYTATEAIDPVSGELANLFNQRSHRWEDHFSWSADFTQMIGCSATGRATVVRLKLNRPPLMKLRRILRTAGEHPPG